MKKVWNWIKARPIVSGVAAATPIIWDIVAGGCMFLGPFGAMGPWGWAALPLVWGLEALATIIIARSMIGKSVTGTLAKTSLVASLATWVAAFSFSPLAGYFAWTAVGTAVGTGVGVLFKIKRELAKGNGFNFAELFGIARGGYEAALKNMEQATA